MPECDDEISNCEEGFLWCFYILTGLSLILNYYPNDTLFHSLSSHQEFPVSLNVSAKRRQYLSSVVAARGSRLGNHLFELTSIYSLSLKLQRTPLFFLETPDHDAMIQDVDSFIPGLIDHYTVVNGSLPPSIKPVQFNMKCCIFDDPERLKNNTNEYLHLAGHHYQSWKYFPRIRTELISYLRKPKSNFTDLPKSDDKTLITCVHIRRTDFLGTTLFVPDKNFIMKSIKFVEEKELMRGNENLTTVFFGDDLEFIRNLMNDTSSLTFDSDVSTAFYISEDSPSESLLYAKEHCDVVLITAPHSTFGWWLGFYSKGNQVYYTDIKFTTDNANGSPNFNADDYYPPTWIPFHYDVADNNNTIIESFK